MDPGSPVRIRETVVRLQRVLAELAADVDRRRHERCPYRTAEDGCTFVGPCENQRPAAVAARQRDVRCAGDHALAWRRDA